MRSMTEHEASKVLEESEGELVPLVQGRLAEVKRVWQACLEQDLPSVVASPPPGEGAPGAFTLLVREEDVPAVAALLQREWKDHLEREGVDPAALKIGVEAPEGEEPPCPACGTAAPLVAGACSECGLQLE
jgi:hypothetical protein